MQFTVNGQFQPIIKSKPGQTEIWVLSNISDMAYMNVHKPGRRPLFTDARDEDQPL